MEHKGLMSTLTIIAVLAIMITLFAYGWQTDTSRSIFIDSYPSGMNVWLGDKDLGKTPLTLEKEKLAKLGFEIGELPLARMFTHELQGLVMTAPDSANAEKLKVGIFFFVKPGPKDAVPSAFGVETRPNAEGAKRQDIELLMLFAPENRLVAVFNKGQLPPMLPERRAQADVSVFSAPMKDSGISMSDFNSCKLKSSSDFRKNK